MGRVLSMNSIVSLLLIDKDLNKEIHECIFKLSLVLYHLKKCHRQASSRSTETPDHIFDLRS